MVSKGGFIKFSQCSCDDIIELFNTIVHHSEIVKMTLKRTKVGYFVNFSIASSL